MVQITMQMLIEDLISHVIPFRKILVHVRYDNCHIAIQVHVGFIFPLAQSTQSSDTCMLYYELYVLNIIICV